MTDLHPAFDEFAKAQSELSALHQATSSAADADEWTDRINDCVEAFRIQRRTYRALRREISQLNDQITEVHREADRVACAAGVTRLPLPVRRRKPEVMAVDDLVPLLSVFNRLRNSARVHLQWFDLADALRFSCVCRLRVIARARSQREKARRYLNECVRIVDQAASSFAVPYVAPV